MYGRSGCDGLGKGEGSGTEKGERWGQNGQGGRGINEDGGGSGVAAGGDGSRAQTTSRSTSVASFRGALRRAIGRPTAWKRYAVDATDEGTLLTPDPSRRKKLCWRWRAGRGARDDDQEKGTGWAATLTPEETGGCSEYSECSDDSGEGELAWQ